MGGAVKDTVYAFRFQCGYCDEKTLMQYRVPEDSCTTRLSCTVCERPLLEIEVSHNYNPAYYSVYDLKRRSWILGSERGGVSGDAF